MTPIVFLPGFDGDASLRQDFVDEMGRSHRVQAISYPNRKLGTIDGYRAHAMGMVPVDWEPFVVAESFGGLIAARWASVDPRVKGIALCGAFARNPVSIAAGLGASLPGLVKLTPWLSAPIARTSRDPLRRRWNVAFTQSLGALDDEVVAERLRLIAAEDVSTALAGLRVPAIVVHFEGDDVVRPASQAHLESVCHNADVLRLPGPHFAIETKPRECAQAIGERIRALAPKTA